MGQFDAELNAVRENPANSVTFVEGRIDVTNDGRSVVSIYPADRSAHFYHEYTQIALSVPELRPLVQNLLSQDYRMNLD